MLEESESGFYPVLLYQKKKGERETCRNISWYPSI